MDRNYKGLLQELCQKKRWPLPVYRISNGFMCTVHVNGTDYGSAMLFPTKKAAEHDAARLALEGLKEKRVRLSLRLPPDVRTCHVLIDAENAAQGIAGLVEDVAEDPARVSWHAFDSSSSNVFPEPLRRAIAARSDWAITTALSTRRDAADVRMIMWLAVIARRMKDDHLFLIVTGDQFGETLAELANADSTLTSRFVVTPSCATLRDHWLK